MRQRGAGSIALILANTAAKGKRRKKWRKLSEKSAAKA